MRGALAARATRSALLRGCAAARAGRSGGDPPPARAEAAPVYRGDFCEANLTRVSGGGLSKLRDGDALGVIGTGVECAAGATRVSRCGIISYVRGSGGGSHCEIDSQRNVTVVWVVHNTPAKSAAAISPAPPRAPPPLGSDTTPQHCSDESERRRRIVTGSESNCEHDYRMTCTYKLVPDIK